MPKSLSQLSAPHRRMVIVQMLEKLVHQADIGATATRGAEGVTIRIPPDIGPVDGNSRRGRIVRAFEKMATHPQANIGATVTKGLEGTTIFIPKGTGSL